MSGHFRSGAVTYDVIVRSASAETRIRELFEREGLAGADREALESIEENERSSTPLREDFEIRVLGADENRLCDQTGSTDFDLRPDVARAKALMSEPDVRLVRLDFWGRATPFSCVTRTLIDLGAIALDDIAQAFDPETDGWPEDWSEHTRQRARWYRRALSRIDEPTILSALTGVHVDRVDGCITIDVLETDGTLRSERATQLWRKSSAALEPLVGRPPRSATS